MSEDIGQGAFHAEAKELLDAMEHALLNLEADAENTEVLAELFRAAHTIKGTGGVFGFYDVVAFTHVVENVLDQVRNQVIKIESELVAILLSCRDHIETLVELAVAEQNMDGEVTGIGNNLIEQLRCYLGVSTDAESDADSDENDNSGQNDISGQVVVQASTVESVSQHPVISDNWHITVRFSENVLRDGMDPLSFLRYLSRLGSIENVVTTNFCQEGFENMNPESCYIGLEIELDSTSSKTEIEQVFEFVREDCVLFILPPKSDINNFLEIIETLSDEKERIGSMLVKCGALTDSELENLLAIQQHLHQSNGSEKQVAPKLGEVVVEQNAVHKEVVNAVVNRQSNNKMNGRANNTIRVDAGKLDQLVNLVGELVIAGAGTNLIARELGDDNLNESISVMSRLVEEIRDGALRLRMVQIGESFSRFRRVVRDVSQELGKDIELVINGAESELDKTVVEKIGDPLMHLVRNAMDHGIESNQERVDAGKQTKAVVTLNAYHD